MCRTRSHRLHDCRLPPVAAQLSALIPVKSEEVRCNTEGTIAPESGVCLSCWDSNRPRGPHQESRGLLSTLGSLSLSLSLFLSFDHYVGEVCK